MASDPKNWWEKAQGEKSDKPRCTRCNDTGFITSVDAQTGETRQVPCPDCPKRTDDGYSIHVDQ